MVVWGSTFKAYTFFGTISAIWICKIRTSGRSRTVLESSKYEKYTSVIQQYLFCLHLHMSWLVICLYFSEININIKLPPYHCFINSYKLTFPFTGRLKKLVIKMCVYFS